MKLSALDLGIFVLYMLAVLGLGLVAVVLASVNIFGGFAVTARMLAMYKKKEKKG